MRAVVRRRALSLEEWLQRFRLHARTTALVPTAETLESSDVQATVVCSGFEWPAATATLALDLLKRLRAFSGADTVEVTKLHGCAAWEWRRTARRAPEQRPRGPSRLASCGRSCALCAWVGVLVGGSRSYS